MTGDNPESSSVAVEPLEWTVHMWVTNPGKRYVILLVSVAAFALGWLLFRDIVVAFVGFIAIMSSTAEFWVPLKYHLDNRVARVRCGISVTEIEWSAVKRVIEGDGGVKLSPLARPTRLAAFRGVFLRYSDNREIVIEYIRNNGGDSASVLGHGTDGN